MFAMRLKLQTDYALRVLLYLAAADRLCPVDEIAGAYAISREHLVKVVQQLAREGWVATRAGRQGGVELSRPAAQISVADVVAAFEGRREILECVSTPSVCVLEPGCDLRRLLMAAEQAFYDALGATTVAELVRRRRGGIANLSIPATRGGSTP